MPVADALAWLSDPYATGFMQRALAAALVIGAVAPLVGVWIVLRRLAYLADAMGHATLGGVAVAYLAGWPLTVGAVAAGACMAGLMGVLASHPRLREDAIVGIVEVALFAAGVLVISGSASVRVDLTHILFGSITTVTAGELALDMALGLTACAVLAALFDPLRAASFDPLHARLVGVRVGPLHTILLVLLAISVVLALQTVGLLMSIALFVIPAAAARLWTRTLAAMSALAVLFGTLSTTIGLTAAYHAGTAPGATIALTTVALLALSFLATRPRRGEARIRSATPTR
jgi:ABC-type Mn2+/Zn2+ transport system permease subunit